MTTEPKRLILNLFEMNCVSHITHGLWRLPGNNRERFNDIEYWLELARLLEDGGFDAVFLADVVGAYDTFRGNAGTAVREGLQIPSNDPLLIVPAMAAVTRHLGFGITFSTTYEPPFSFARRMSTLDHLTKGRVGWNIVTSYLPNAARNFGLDGEIDHDQRFEIAEEYLEVLYKLWEGSWEEDAIVADKANGVYADPAKVHAIDHEGEHYKVAGPHLASPSRQRSPLLITATASPRGIRFAGKHAEALFTGGGTPEAVQDTIARVRAAAADAGREPGDVKFVVGAGVVVAATEEQARAKLARYQQYSSVEGRLAHGGFGFDPTAHPRDTLVRDVAGENAFGRRSRGPFSGDQTVGELLDALADLSRGPFFAVGGPGQVADAIESWLDDVGIDGINLTQHHSFDTARDFVEHVVPELRRRGRLRPAYRDGETLRDRVHGAGDRLPERHPAARYRRAPALAVPTA
ncbi:NtaA/DmoA family FMN-dependent monooxygenase [Jiangella endophytica]|uniref:NtaA/DmoA family FMN-dependent monooxygenase n=1 Tax=Jiangella endophytica TaxID=1623398 RepID=UPI000E355EBA|nr:NtaA/DmoA family FMN-dependent monooxygenase [Jiangella endophytica]